MSSRRRKGGRVGSPPQITPTFGEVGIEGESDGMKLAQALLHIFYYCKYSGSEEEPCKVLKPFIEKYFKQLEERMGRG